MPSDQAELEPALLWRSVFYDYPSIGLDRELTAGIQSEYVTLAIEPSGSVGFEKDPAAYQTKYFRWAPEGLVPLDGPLPGRMA